MPALCQPSPSAFSIVAQLVKNLPVMQETWVRSLDWEDPLEKRKATHSSILAWRIPWTVWSMGCQKGASLIAQLVKNLPAVQETWARLLGCPIQKPCMIYWGPRRRLCSFFESESESCSVMSKSLPHGLQPARVLSVHGILQARILE